MKQKGNVLFLILIAVALFSALSYVVTNSSRFGGEGLSEKQKLAAAEIIQYGSYVRQQVDRIRLTEQIPPERLDFSSDVFLTSSSSSSIISPNPNCTSSNCRVFATNGGIVVEQTFEQYTSEPTIPNSSTRAFKGHTDIHRVNLVGVGTSKEDIIMQIMHIDQEICEAVNDLLGLPSSTFDNVEGFQEISYEKDYYNLDNATAAPVIGDDATPLQNQASGCFRSSSTVGYVYYHTLVER